MRVASHQPCFLPWPGFWHKALSVDVFVLSAGVEWAKDGYLNRIEHAGSWLTLPVDAKDDSRICDVRIAKDQRRLTKTCKSLAQVSGAHKSRLEPFIEALRAVEPGHRILEINVLLLQLMAGTLDAKVSFRMTTDAGSGDTTTERMLNRIGMVAPEMTAYYAGRGALDYLEKSKFGQRDVFVQDPSRFSSSPSIVQLIANEPDPADWIMSRGSWRKLS